MIPFEPRLYEIAKERAALIMTATSIDELKPEGWIAGGNECNYCPFTGACGIARRNLPFADQPLDPQFTEEILQLATRLKLHEAAGKAEEDTVRELQEEIKTRLRAKSIRKIPGVVSWTSVKGRAGFDMKALKEAATVAGIDITQFETAGEPGDRLTIQVGSSSSKTKAA